MCIVKKVVAIIALVLIASLSIAGCTSSTYSNQEASSASQAASTTATTTANTTTNATTSASATAGTSTSENTLDPATTVQQTDVQSYSFVGSKNSNVYHYQSCSEAKKIKSENLVVFNTLAEACAAGYRACKVCNPPPCGATPPPTPTQAKEQTTMNFYIMQSGFMQGPVKRGTTTNAAVQLNTPQHPAFCGQVSFYVDGTFVGTSQQSAGSTCLTQGISFSTTPFSVGYHTVSANYGSDDTHTSASAQASMEIIA